MTPLQLKNFFRSDVRDEAAPYLWSDAEIYSYMDDAQKMFCRLTGGLADYSSPLCEIPVSAGARTVAYDPRILKLRGIRRVSDGEGVKVLNYEDMDVRYADHRNWERPGPIQAVITGMEANKLVLVGTPVVDDALRATVYRLPLEAVTETSTSFEIDEQHHRHLLSWMKHLAHEKQDAETYDRGRAAEFRQKFLEYCAEAKGERERREHKYRTISYGGL